jgi:hypothetical protein
VHWHAPSGDYPGFWVLTKYDDVRAMYHDPATFSSSGTMEVITLTIACHEGPPPADDIFAYPGCPQPVPARSPCQGPGPAEEARPPACAGGAAGRGDRAGDRGVEVVRRDRAVGRRCRPGGAGGAGRGPRREEQGREGAAPGGGAGARHRRGPRPGRRGGEVERDPCGAGAMAAGPAARSRSRWRWRWPGSSSRAPPRSRSCAARSRRTAGRPSRSSTSSPVTVTSARPPWPPGSADIGR